jgi:hypothetical protein
MKLLIVARFALLIAVPAIAQEAIHGYVNYVDHPNNRLYLTTDDGRPVTVDISAGHASANARRSGEAVMAFGKASGASSFVAERVIADRDRAQTTQGMPQGWQSVTGRVERVDGSRLQLRTDDGRVLTVDTSQVAQNVRSAVQQGDTITVIGEAARQTPQFFAARYIQGDRTSQTLAQSSGGPAEAPWQRIHGRVENLSGSTFTMKGDDGRNYTVDMSQVNPNVQRALTQNEGVEVVGHFKSGDNRQIAARWIQQDSSNLSRGGHQSGTSQTAQPAPQPAAPAPPAQAKGDTKDQQAWQRIHGKVDSIQGSTLRLKADDGRMYTVDISKVSENVRKAISQGEGVTVVGHFGSDQSHLNAQYVQQDRTGGAASPKTDNKKDKDDKRK